VRFLFTFAGGAGHFLPLLPLARGLASKGHVVGFGAQAAMMAAIERAGFEAFDTGGPTIRDAAVRGPLLRLDMEREYRVVRDAYAGRIARERASAIFELARSWKPDLLVCDEMDFGCPVAAERLSLPHATVLVIASGMLARRDLIAFPLNRLRAEHELSPDPELAMLSRHLVLSPFPPSLRYPSSPVPDTTHAFRPTSPEPNLEPNWLPASPGKPLVYVTLGTVFNTEAGGLFARLVAGVRDLPVEVIATVGPQQDPAELGPQPGNVRVERFIDQWSVLPRCSLVVSHAGSGTVYGALAHGLPMLLLPMGADQPLNAQRCKELGAAVVLDPLDATAMTIREAAALLLSENRYRNAARKIAAEISALPGQHHALGLLTALAAQGAARSARE
jgi:UDP:flavonoid glycosyltransferase YjiC (YdhE family)